MRYQVKFIESVEGRDTISHGGVSFPVGKAVTIDSEKVEMAPWFIGNRSFHVEEMTDEPTISNDEKPQPDAEKPVVKRARKKVAAK